MTIMIRRNNLGLFLSKSYFNFEVSLLQKTVVVIHGDDFIHFILKNVIGFKDNNHNEFLLFSMTASKLISQVQMCDIQPLFIFDGCTKVGVSFIFKYITSSSETFVANIYVSLSVLSLFGLVR